MLLLRKLRCPVFMSETHFPVKSIMDHQGEHEAEQVLLRSFSFLESYQTLYLYKTHVLCQAETCCVSDETFQCSDTWYYRGGIAPLEFRSAASQKSLLVWRVLCGFFPGMFKSQNDYSIFDYFPIYLI